MLVLAIIGVILGAASLAVCGLGAIYWIASNRK